MSGYQKAGNSPALTSRSSHRMPLTSTTSDCNTTRPNRNSTNCMRRSGSRKNPAMTAFQPRLTQRAARFAAIKRFLLNSTTLHAPRTEPPNLRSQTRSPPRNPAMKGRRLRRPLPTCSTPRVFTHGHRVRSHLDSFCHCGTLGLICSSATLALRQVN